MYCNTVIPLRIDGERVNLVVTEANFIPDSKGGWFEIEAGYVVEDGYDFTETYNAHAEYVQKIMKAWMAEEKYQNTTWSLEI